ncbi:PilZ domain-containing protein [Noviherbaspirillum aerium]|uniref:PilZ domain-containing protein n=1 Tax=Noviherbaspirillum aerium TaxID=2588497 RepID=UPI00384BF056
MHSKAACEKRHSTRATVSIATRLLLSSAGPCKATAIDLSTQGMGLITGSAVPVGVRCAVAFEVTTRHGRRRINAWATAIHCVRHGDQRFHIGIRLGEMDPDSRVLLEESIADVISRAEGESSKLAQHAS